MILFYNMQILYLNSDKVGKGDDKLGKLLMINFLKNLLEKPHDIQIIICVNSAVFLTCENSKTIDILNSFKENGVLISSCGTCLDFYNLRNKLEVGEVGSMSMITELFLKANKIITP